ncbi:MAG: methyl-accepting chemotaxis protein [Rhodocyclaceae bacterium]|nr:methyl-accepting chemotaxis protein [Rhodocyclaceae bacterium]
MESDLLLRRQGLVGLAVGLGVAVVVFFGSGWYHQSFIPGSGLSAPWGAAIGAVLIVLVALIAQRFVSFALYKDMAFGLQKSLDAATQHDSSLTRVTAEVGSELGQIPKFNEVVRGQLSTVVTETEAAAYNVVSQLQTIDEVVNDLSGFINATTAQSHALMRQAEARIDKNKALLGNLEAYIAQRIAETQSDQQRVAQVVADAKSLTSLVELIKHIAGQTNLLALNAAIEAARAGEAGRGFAVVADEVRKLSGESEKAVQKINQGIERVAASIESQFAEKLAHSNIDAERSALQNFADQLMQLGISYQEVAAHGAQVVSKVGQSSEKLSGMFMDALASIQFQDVTRQQIEQAVSALNRLDGHTGLLAERLERFDDPNFTMTLLSQHLDEIYSSYVMSSQRQAHHGSLKTGSAAEVGASKKIELF